MAPDREPRCFGCDLGVCHPGRTLEGCECWCRRGTYVPGCRRPHRAAMLLAVAALAAGCTSSSSSSTVAPLPPSAVGSSGLSTPATLGCAWYTATRIPGQVVHVTATGPACQDRSVIDMLVRDSDRPWTTEGVIPGSYGHELATLRRGGSAVTIWFTWPLPSHNATASPGTQSATPAAELAGRLAQAFEDAGWRPA